MAKKVKFKAPSNKQLKGRMKWELKPYSIPDGMILAVDTREQKPMCLDVPGLTAIRMTLHDGDYSIKGFTKSFSIERKQESDFYSYISSERTKTIRKLKRLAKFEFAALVIESSLEDLMIPGMFTSISPEVARQFLISIRIRYGIHVFTHSKRSIIEQFIIDSAIKYYRMKRGV